MADENEKRAQLLWRTVWKVLKKLILLLLYDAFILLQGVHPRKIKKT